MGQNAKKPFLDTFICEINGHRVDSEFWLRQKGVFAEPSEKVEYRQKTAFNSSTLGAPPGEFVYSRGLNKCLDEFLV